MNTKEYYRYFNLDEFTQLCIRYEYYKGKLVPSIIDSIFGGYIIQRYGMEHKNKKALLEMFSDLQDTFLYINDYCPLSKSGLFKISNQKDINRESVLETYTIVGENLARYLSMDNLNEKDAVDKAIYDSYQKLIKISISMIERDN